MTGKRRLLWGIVLFVMLFCDAAQAQRVPALSSSTSSDIPQSAIGGAEALVRPEVERYMGSQSAALLKLLATSRVASVRNKMPAVVRCLESPWAGLAELETAALSVASSSDEGLAAVPKILRTMYSLYGRKTKKPPPAGSTPTLAGTTLADHAAYIMAVLDRCDELCREASAAMSEKDRRFMLAWAKELALHFRPHFYGTDPAWLRKYKIPADSDAILRGDNLGRAKKDRRFVWLATEKLDMEKLLHAAELLAGLAEPDFLRSLVRAAEAQKPAARAVGVKGTVLYQKYAPTGLVIIGGGGPNTYDLIHPAAVIIDLGGDDTYKGSIAATLADKPGCRLVIDLGGDDTYEAGPLGLATGRGGVGLLADMGGNDTYKLQNGSGGVGLGGIGVLYDGGGNDKYIGARFTQAASFCGLGLLFDRAGDDTYSSFGYAIGLGGPGGAAVLLDAGGDDSYQCGGKFPSGYNPPKLKPAAPGFQYSAFGLGAGVGKRIFTPNHRESAYNLAGGVGMLIDRAGNDKYDGANFSQGCGHFFAAGVKLDLGGDDVHHCARYGQAAAAHHGAGLFIDYAGDDKYSTSGPACNCAAAQDQSVAMFMDAAGQDSYDLANCPRAVANASVRSWAVAVELAGKDVYIIPKPGLGSASKNSLAVFLDAAGEDDYEHVGPRDKFIPENRQTNLQAPGGLFVDK